MSPRREIGRGKSGNRRTTGPHRVCRELELGRVRVWRSASRTRLTIDHLHRPGRYMRQREWTVIAFGLLGGLALGGLLFRGGATADHAPTVQRPSQPVAAAAP